jgi:excinuclease ABC subunit A
MDATLIPAHGKEIQGNDCLFSNKRVTWPFGGLYRLVFRHLAKVRPDAPRRWPRQTMSNFIEIKGAREHNLRNLSLKIPRDKLVVITGLSGSGKSSLAFDTIYAEGQRRYVESLSAYARQFLGLMEKPDVDFIDGLSPAISIEQRTSARNPRSTVGTVTEIYDYLRLLYARIGTPFCPRCSRPISRQTVSQMVDHLMDLPAKTRMLILAPLVVGRKGEHKDILDQIKKKGLVRVRIDGEIYELDDAPALNKKTKHTIEAVVDRLISAPTIKSRLADSLETALRLAGGTAKAIIGSKEEVVFSESAACPSCGLSFEEPSPRLFSFNSPFGACATCSGLGHKLEIDPALVLPDPSRSIFEGAIVPWGEDPANWYRFMLRGVANHFNFNFKTRFCDLPKEAQKVVLFGSGSKNSGSPTSTPTDGAKGSSPASSKVSYPTWSADIVKPSPPQSVSGSNSTCE